MTELEGTVSALAATVAPPVPQNLWEYTILLILSGGGAVAVKQFIGAYKVWKESRQSEDKRLEINRENVVEKIVTMLQDQLDEQNEDYNTRLADKDSYYQAELERRSKIADENILRKSQLVQELQSDNKRLRRLLARYQEKFGYLHVWDVRDTGEETTDNNK